jgi:phosphoribosylamine--glycine ligase
MRVLVIGSGGREHALAWRLHNSPSVDEVISAPGNPGMATLGETVPIAVDDLAALADLASDRAVDLTVVGPEIPLVAGITDVLAERGLTVFGPSKAAAQIEGSKVFCRDLSLRHGVPVAQGESFDDADAAIDFARTIAPPIVVKAEGLAAGKGVLICQTHDEAVAAVDTIMRQRAFGDSGGRVIVEEFLEGRETSIFCLTDGTTKLVLEPAQDYKRAFDGDEGPNTGGMGSYTPVPWLSPETRQEAIDRIVFPLIDAMAAEGRTFRGCFYAGLIFTAKGPYLIEVNCRFGDPETQVLMPRLSSDLGELLLAVAEGRLASQHVEWSQQAGVSVVVASGGYPGAYETGKRIGLPDDSDDVVIFHAGTKLEDGNLVSAGGRVLNVTAIGPSIPAARDLAYAAVGKIEMEGSFARTDIAKGIE